MLDLRIFTSSRPFGRLIYTMKTYIILVLSFDSIESNAQFIGVPFHGLPYYSSCNTAEWIDSTTFYASNPSSAYCYYSSDAGESIDTIRLPAIAESKLQFISRNEAFQISYLQNKLFHTNNRWDTWEEVNISDSINKGYKSGKMSVFHFWEDGTGVIVGDSTSGCLEIWTTKNYGVQWQKCPCSNSITRAFDFNAPFGLGAMIFEIDSNSGLLYNGRNSNFLLKTSDRGMHWIEMPVPKEFHFSRRFAFKDDSNWICGRLGNYPKETSMARTHDGGLTWDTSQHSEHYFGSIQYVKGTKTYPGMLVSGGLKLHYSLDDGYSWKLLDTNRYENISFYNAERGMLLVKNRGNEIGGYLFDAAVLPDPNSVVKPIGNQFSVYPNPCHRLLTIENPGQETRVTLIGVDGKTHGHWTLHQGTNKLRLNVPAGIYFIRDAEGAFCEKVVVVD